MIHKVPRTANIIARENIEVLVVDPPTCFRIFPEEINREYNLTLENMRCVYVYMYMYLSHSLTTFTYCIFGWSRSVIILYGQKIGSVVLYSTVWLLHVSEFM